MSMTMLHIQIHLIFHFSSFRVSAVHNFLAEYPAKNAIFFLRAPVLTMSNLLVEITKKNSALL